jgi:hypothetical protein
MGCVLASQVATMMVTESDLGAKSHVAAAALRVRWQMQAAVDEAAVDRHLGLARQKMRSAEAFALACLHSCS